ncbi:MAG: sigma-70 family RNA polymerase sigma factor [Salinarimonadaceae bacterium]|nr:MAG: sigma-70 family RNA polymerase sigma factor [Salinarimonadaceae bacterium]
MTGLMAVCGEIYLQSSGEGIMQVHHHPFQILLPPHHVALRRYALKLTANEHRAEDLVQETFLKAWANREMFSLGTDLRAWLFTILRNTFYSEFRKYKNEIEDIDGKFAETLFEKPAQEYAVELKELVAAIATLSDIHRRPLVLMEAYGFSQLEAADACGCSVGTIKSRVFRARAKLSQAFGRESVAQYADGGADLTRRGSH